MQQSWPAWLRTEAWHTLQLRLKHMHPTWQASGFRRSDLTGQQPWVIFCAPSEPWSLMPLHVLECKG